MDDRANSINPFMTELTDYVHTKIDTDIEVSFAAPAVNWGGWDLSGLAAACDYLFVMGYDFWGSWSSTAGPSAPLIGGNINVTNTLTNISNGYGAVVNNTPEKLILGVPYYGNNWRTATQNEGSTRLEYIGSRTYTKAKQELGTRSLLWSSNYKVPWYAYESSGSHYQTWYDNDVSLGLKYDLAKSKNLKGIGMWALGYDSYHTELWDLLREKFYSDDLDTSDGFGYASDFMLHQNYPNPFNPGTTIEYYIPPTSTSPFEGGQRGMNIILIIYDISGNEIVTLVNENQPPGRYSVKFNVETQNLASLPNGVYFYQLRVGNFIKTKKMLLIK